jgi:integrase
LIPKRQWPAVEFKEKRSITLVEHQAIVAREQNPERKAFYKLAWHLGASQSDLAFLEAENVDWDNHVISYKRMKTGTVSRGEQNRTSFVVSKTGISLSASRLEGGRAERCPTKRRDADKAGG